MLTVCVSVFQINWSLSKQELLFSDFCEDSDNIEEGADYNKVFWLFETASQGIKHSYWKSLMETAREEFKHKAFLLNGY